jgi:UDP-N-acetyl-D-galactosamine dehydrogenase
MSNTPARRIAVIGLGYVGLPVAVAMARRFPGTLGFDIDAAKVARLAAGEDRTGELDAETLRDTGLKLTTDPGELKQADFFIVAVPTPIDRQRKPDLEPLRAASRTVGAALSPGAIVVYESTVYPGVTEEVCAPILEQASGLRAGVDFKLGYSPERINPGDKVHRFDNVVKVVSGQDEDSLATICAVYGEVVEAGLHRAASIKVAEACKVIENVQRDLNIAFMNELAVIFDKLDIDTRAVLDAAGTKWNFLRFHPGLVGGHCIGVDPYYLTTKAEELGITPQVILAGRRINDGMGEFVARRTLKELALAGGPLRGAKVAVLGLSFKENVADIRNSRVPDIVDELRAYGAEVLVHDPLVEPEEARAEYDIELVSAGRLRETEPLDVVILAVPHAGLADLARELAGRVRVLSDVRALFDPAELPDTLRYWRL